MTPGDYSIISFQNQVVTMKLDRTNYFVWKQQIMNILYSFDLEHFLTNDEPL